MKKQIDKDLEQFIVSLDSMTRSELNQKSTEIASKALKSNPVSFASACSRNKYLRAINDKLRELKRVSK